MPHTCITDPLSRFLAVPLLFHVRGFLHGFRHRLHLLWSLVGYPVHFEEILGTPVDSQK